MSRTSTTRSSLPFSRPGPRPDDTPAPAGGRTGLAASNAPDITTPPHLIGEEPRPPRGGHTGRRAATEDRRARR
ncbi:hypothetical protein AB0G15_41790 [Streptosporangium sp. NPDC023825]|uniref:hypothetical protein n=1 Tax=Streptosporangium sp. NPDC023825 TaxID=3154909 RepID=UPI00342F8EA7